MTEVEVNLNGYHGGLFTPVSNNQLQKCSENKVEGELSLDNKASLNSDPAVVNMLPHRIL